jgi:hypothetical protein
VTSACLRETVYDPIVERAFVRPPAGSSAGSSNRELAAADSGTFYKSSPSLGLPGACWPPLLPADAAARAGLAERDSSESSRSNESSGTVIGGSGSASGSDETWESSDSLADTQTHADQTTGLRGRFAPKSAVGGDKMLSIEKLPSLEGKSKGKVEGQSFDELVEAAGAAEERLRMAARLAVFLASGVMHELVIW